MAFQHAFELAGMISGQLISEENIQVNQKVAISYQSDLGLYVFAHDSTQNNQFAAKQSIDILIDDMGFNLGESQNLTSNEVATCLHESIENINDFLIEQNQVQEGVTGRKGLSMASFQRYEKGICCSMNGDVFCLKISPDKAETISSKISMIKALGINSDLSFSVIESDFKNDEVLFISTNSLAKQLTSDFIRLTLSRFSSNLEMAIKQIKARVSKTHITQDLSFLMIRNHSESTEKKSWFS